MRPAVPLRETTAEVVTSLFAQHAHFVWRSLQRLGVRTSDLDDALQEVFVIVHRRLASYDTNAKVRSWIFGICIKVAARFRRRAHVRREEVVDPLQETSSPASGLSPEEATLAAEARRQLTRVLDTLDPQKRVVFVMFEIDGMDCSEIGRDLDIPIGTVYSRLHAARKAFTLAARRERARRRRER